MIWSVSGVFLERLVTLTIFSTQIENFTVPIYHWVWPYLSTNYLENYCSEISIFVSPKARNWSEQNVCYLLSSLSNKRNNCVESYRCFSKRCQRRDTAMDVCQLWFNLVYKISLRQNLEVFIQSLVGIAKCLASFSFSQRVLSE